MSFHYPVVPFAARVLFPAHVWEPGYQPREIKKYLKKSEINQGKSEYSKIITDLCQRNTLSRESL